MEWQLALLVIMGTLIVLMLSGLPVAFCFMLINVVGVFVWWGGVAGLQQLADGSLYDSVTTFTLLPLPLFILMGEVLFRSGIAPNMLDAVDKWLGRMPGRLALEAVAGGTILSTLTGAPIASVAILGSSLVPEMEKRGYKKSMSLGPIMGSGGIAMMIPPSGLAVLLASLALISIGKTLIAIIIPGLLMAALYALYIIGRCWLQPSVAPPYSLPPLPLKGKLAATLKYIVPVGGIIFLVIGVILLGIATPTEAAATGSLGTFILAAAYGKLNWGMMKESFSGALKVTVMILMIIVGAKAFGQVLASSGATQGLIQFTVGLPLAPILIFILMQVVILIMGMFVSLIAIMMVTLPIFMPVVNTMGFDPWWFAVIFLINIEISTTSPPFGLGLYVMKGVAPPDTTMGDVYRAALPFIYCDLVAMALIIAFPQIALWLPGLMR